MSPTPLLTALIVGSVAVGQESSPSTEERYRPIIQQIEQALPAWLTEAPDCLRWPDCMTESKDTQKAVELLKDSLATDERLIRAGRRGWHRCIKPEFARPADQAQKRYPAVHKLKDSLRSCPDKCVNVICHDRFGDVQKMSWGFAEYCWTIEGRARP